MMLYKKAFLCTSTLLVTYVMYLVFLLYKRGMLLSAKFLQATW